MNSNIPLLDVLQGRLPSRRPIWLMRQAGRYLPEYRQVRKEAGSFLGLCYNPELACEVTLQPLRRYDLDAAILFADILVVPQAMGVDVRFEEGEGPLLSTVTSMEAVRGLRRVRQAVETVKVCETVARVKAALPAGKALIGFCGAPWTVASYMVEGGSSDRSKAKRAALERHPWFDALIDHLVEESVEYLSAQIEAGAKVVQIFDSWAGELAGSTGERYVMEPLIRMCEALRSRHPDVPVIVFARGFGVRQVEVAARTRAACVGLESELPMRWAAANVAEGTALQGNLDPVALLPDRGLLRREAEEILSAVPMRRHVFNLGHGIRQQTDPESVSMLIEAIRSFDRSGSGG